MNARVYDPFIARFMAADPVTATPYDGQSLNRYTYVDNRPLSLTDLTGLLADCSLPGSNCHQDQSMKNSVAVSEKRSAFDWHAADGTAVDISGTDANGWQHGGTISKNGILKNKYKVEELYTQVSESFF